MANEPESEHATDLRSFGRRRGRKLSPRQEQLLTEVLPRIRVDLSMPCNGLRTGEYEGAPAPAAGSPAGPSHDAPRNFLEIGFGGGEHLVWQAAHNRDATIIGCEPFEEGVVKVLSAIQEQGLGNIRIHPDDARPLIRSLPDRSIDRVFILFPDPWPKKRHAKRRLVSEPLVASLARVMKPGADLRVATDIGDYARSTLLAVQGVAPRFAWTARGPGDWRIRPDDWPGTRYEAKALREGRRCYFLSFRRSCEP